MRGHGFVIALGILAASGCKGNTAAPPVTAPAPAAIAPLAMVVLVEGHTLWMGNDTFERDPPPQRYYGNFAGACTAIDALAAAPARAELIVYGEEAKVQRPFDDAKLSCASLGTQKRYRDVTVRDLFPGIALARKELAAQAATRKVLVIIGDGANTRDSVDVAETLEGLKADGITTYTLEADAPTFGGDPGVMKQLGAAGSFSGDLEAGARQILALIAKPS